jgi:hypothetical protein
MPIGAAPTHEQVESLLEPVGELVDVSVAGSDETSLLRCRSGR